ncbi:MAG: cell envelope integrity protein CreD [Gammaproteobacteria bacterium]|nr:cell envelope integrity protein CreD [Gammaproteobacteria bacterium]
MFNIEPVTLRFILVSGIIVGLMIPLFLILVLVFERQDYYEDAVADVAQAWSDNQSFSGPMLLAETKTEVRTSTSEFKTETLVLMPIDLTLSLESSHEMRNRGIYRIPVFSATVIATATFAPVAESSLPGELQNAAIAVGITDSRGVRSATIHWNDDALEEQTSSQMGAIGNIVKTELSRSKLIEGGTVSVKVELRGTGRFSVLPVGDKTVVSMNSDWPHPSFDGRYLPDEREVTDSGFSASWTTHALSRGFPAQLTVTEFDETISALRRNSRFSSDLGFSILTLNTPYRAVERSIKYGILFVVMTMIGIICIELVSRTQMHIVQYGVVGVGLVLFFLMVLSLSEHIGFGPGYAIAAAILASMNTAYVWFASRSPSVAVSVFSMLLVLYVALYVVLQLNEYALLVGSALLLILLGALMYSTRILRADSAEETADT